jgi:hypothetical protein
VREEVRLWWQPRRGPELKIQLRNSMRVGTRAWNGSVSAEKTGEWSSSIGVEWVEVDGVRIPGDVVGVELRPMRAGREREFATCVVELIVGKFEVVGR